MIETVFKFFTYKYGFHIGPHTVPVPQPLLPFIYLSVCLTLPAPAICHLSHTTIEWAVQWTKNLLMMTPMSQSLLD
nr:unnamed protein product [Callosobruchus chinensis]